MSSPKRRTTTTQARGGLTSSSSPGATRTTTMPEAGLQVEEGPQVEAKKKSLTLKTHLTTCVYCNSKLIDPNRYATTTIYTRNGPVEAQHAEMRCINRECRVGYRHGYHIKNESVIYDIDALSNEILIVSRRTGFEVLYLYEAVMTAFHGNVSFSAICDIYNSVHSHLISKDVERFSLYLKRLSRAFFTYALLDIGRRYNLKIDFHQDDIDHTISSNFDQLQMLIQEKWGHHQCQVKGCGEVLVIDGGLKPTRKVCAARTAAVYEFKHADIRTVVGCKTYPTPGQKFCAEHLSAEVPNVPCAQMSRENVRALRTTRQSVKKREGGRGCVYY